ncbi:peptidoglycan recognition protein family protein [Saccharopolyspora mangrovi]|uniref:N-acetylmuramoyl-L-alanine amidase n=1 Tax=Saccharopolyspora mangrovi TaxID=3082379 RepID=A0ABU6A7J4_9PSEU|nr:N-acetylmuramoyl-L-alanine amidase [Saccharopolyspora sp. S2-29]MEB3367427.1 N-acetylmuramoyl-L-alanine amidase [Saccharopolyspora sp. S2-29]
MSFADDVAHALRARGVFVHFASGYNSRGNGSVWNGPQGGIMHHTASAYANALPGTGIYNVLVNGHSTLSGPLCNSAGNEDGSVTIISAGPANHAGASGGSWARPFPDTRDFNRMVWGHEICYPGVSPMRPAQWNTMVILGQVLCQLLNRGPEWIRGHYETSVTGKWDPGFAEGRWIDMNEVRRQIAEGGDDMFDDAAKRRVDNILFRLAGTSDLNEIRRLRGFPGFPSWVNPAHKLTPVNSTRFAHKNTVITGGLLNQMDAEANRIVKELADQNGEDRDALLADTEAAALEGVAEGVAEAQVRWSVKIKGKAPSPEPEPEPPQPT